MILDNLKGASWRSNQPRKNHKSPQFNGDLETLINSQRLILYPNVPIGIMGIKNSLCLIETIKLSAY